MYIKFFDKMGIYHGYHPLMFDTAFLICMVDIRPKMVKPVKKTVVHAIRIEWQNCEKALIKKPNIILKD